MDGIKTKKLVENAEMDFAELMYQMYAEPGNSYGDISRYFAENDIKVYDKSLKRGFIAQLLRKPCLRPGRYGHLRILQGPGA